MCIIGSIVVLMEKFLSCQKWLLSKHLCVLSLKNVKSLNGFCSLERNKKSICSNTKKGFESSKENIFYAIADSGVHKARKIKNCTSCRICFTKISQC